MLNPKHQNQIYKMIDMIKRKFQQDLKLLNQFILIKHHKKTKKDHQVLLQNLNKTFPNKIMLKKLSKQTYSLPLNKKVKEIQFKKLHFNPKFKKKHKLHKQNLLQRKLTLIQYSFQNLKN